MELTPTGSSCCESWGEPIRRLLAKWGRRQGGERPAIPRGFRWWNKGGGSRTSNNHFTRDVLRDDGTNAYVGYGVDSLTVGLVAVCRVKFDGER
jgi:hypothetical protein